MQYKPNRADLIACRDCGEQHGSYMVQQSVWREAMRQSSVRFLCLPCLELRIGRPVMSEDLVERPINSALLHVMRRYERRSE